MTQLQALLGARIFDGEEWHERAALVLRGGLVEAILPEAALPVGAEILRLEGGMLAPGFVDLQVNGGGGVLLNAEPSLESIGTICRAHARFGTTALLPTLVTSAPETAARAVEAARAAEGRVAGFLGLHLEGPHLSVARKGAHDAKLVRPMGETDLALLIEAKRHLAVLLVTVAPESVSPAQIRRLAEAGIVVSLGHSDAGFAAQRAAAEAGAVMATHLFNAMSQIGPREPGLVGAVLETGGLSAGLIADGFHVDPASIRVALRAKRGPGRIFLVTDAMSTVGSDIESFTLDGRTVFRQRGATGGRLTLADGTLAGADIDMASSVRFLHETVGVALAEALRMASLYPAEAIGLAPGRGRLEPGSRADIVHLSERIEPLGTWIGGVRAAGVFRTD